MPDQSPTAIKMMFKELLILNNLNLQMPNI